MSAPVQSSGLTLPPGGGVSEPKTAPPNVGLVLLGILGAMLLSMLDNLIVGTAVPT